MPLVRGAWIDVFNGSANTEISGTILTTIDSSKNYYVMEKALNPEKDGTSRTIKAQYQQSSRANFQREDGLGASGATDGYRIRKFTPRECFRLMGVSEPDIDTLLSCGISNSQLYKLAGNSIVVNCLAAIFRQLFIGNQNKNQQLEIF